MSDFNSYDCPYGYVWIHGTGTYGHMEVTINNLIGGSEIFRKPRLKIHCQIGSSDSSYHEQYEKPYAWRYGMEGSEDLMALNELEVSVKFMRSFERKMAKLNDELGWPDSYYEFCARILICSGVDHVFFNPAWGGYSKLENLPCVRLTERCAKGELRDQLRKLEAIMIAKYSGKAA